MGLTAGRPEKFAIFATETSSVEPQVVAQSLYDWLQIQYQESALAAIEGFAVGMDNNYKLAGIIGENVMRFALQYDRQSRTFPSFERFFVMFLQRNLQISVSESQVHECLEALGWHILAQLSVYRLRPQERVPGY